MNRLKLLHDAGTSIWLDTIRRNLVTSGQLERMIAEDAVTGVTSNPTIFEKAFAGSTDYDDAIRDLLASGVDDPLEVFLAVGLEDIRAAADLLRTEYEATGGADGFASFEVSPDLANDTAGTIEQARELWRRLDRPNAMVKVPGTEAGIPAIEELVAEGLNVNVTLLFSVERYEQAALAYIAGLERRLTAALPVDRVASVASFFVSRVDTAVDRALPGDSPLRGHVAVANARRAYRRFRQLFSGPRWERLQWAGARVQRPLWASTGTKDPAYSDVLYVEELIGPDTVNTMPEHTLLAFKHHGEVRASLDEGLDDAERMLAEAEAAGVRMEEVTARLLDEGVEAFAESHRKLLDVVGGQIEAIRRERSGPPSSLGGLRGAVDERLRAIGEADLPRRMWERDFTLWRQSPEEISDRLGWLTVHEVMQERVPELKEFAAECAADGLRLGVLAGMGGSSLAPEVLRAAFGVSRGALDLVVLDTTHPDQIVALDAAIDPERTLFVIASKSGTTTETLSHLAHFWERVPDGSRFVAITDPGTPLERLAAERGFRRTFANPSDIGGRYSALSYFGLVPGALVGADLDGLLDRAKEMAEACATCVPCSANPGAWLGSALGEAARAGRDKLTLAPPAPFGAFGAWIEQLIAESTGKEGRGILPVDGEDLGAPDAYGDDRLFVAYGDGGARALDALAAAGHPVVRLPGIDPVELGREFYRWEFATAIAGAILGIHPFDQPNVQEAKDATRRLLSGGDLPDPGYGDPGEVLGQARPGDYLAIQAYLPRTGEVEARLQSARMRLRDRLRLATTVGFGPRYLHSTGQLHKGGPDTGIFLQVVEPAEGDVPIPGEPYSFGSLLAAQALGDLEALRGRGRRVVRVRLADLEAAAGG